MTTGFFDLNVILPRSAKNQVILDPPVQTLKTLVALHRSQYNIVAINQVIYGAPKRGLSRIQFDSNRWISKVLKEDSILLGPKGSNRSKPFQILKRLTYIAEDGGDILGSLSFDILSNYDLIAIQVTSQQTFQLACEQAQVDIISIDCSQRLPFHPSRKTIQAALKRGICFELSYSNAFKDNSSRRYLFSNAQQLSNFTNASSLILSSGAIDQYQIRGPYDIVNLCGVLGITKSMSQYCISQNPKLLVDKARKRKEKQYGLSEKENPEKIMKRAAAQEEGGAQGQTIDLIKSKKKKVRLEFV